MFVLVIIAAFFLLFSIDTEGARMYNKLSQRCCEGNVFNISEFTTLDQYLCCGAQGYEPVVEYYTEAGVRSELISICCKGRLHSNVSREALCCGWQPYQPSNRTCYEWGQDGSQVIDLTEDNQKEGKNAFCGKSAEEKQPYDALENDCCSGALFKREEGKKCCGQRYVDTSLSACCEENVKDEKTKSSKKMTSVVDYNGVQPESFQCCNGSGIDTTKQMCCEDVAVDTEGVSNPTCCGSQLVKTDWTDKECFSGKYVVNVANKRRRVSCGGQIHEISGDENLTVFCLDGNIYRLKGSEGLCSVNGSYVTYDRTKRVCAYHQLIDWTEKQRDSVCFSADEYETGPAPFLIYFKQVYYDE